MGLVKQQVDFDAVLAGAVYDTIRYCLGETNAEIIRDFLEKRGLPLALVSCNPELFSEELRNIVGFGRRQILGGASILEETILELLCKRLGLKLVCARPVNFALEVRRLRKQFGKV
ncbi:MAG: hypothetical protein ABSG33_05185 [Candidatus Bathyarchaeia archaeon]